MTGEDGGGANAAGSPSGGGAAGGEGQGVYKFNCKGKRVAERGGGWVRVAWEVWERSCSENWLAAVWGEGGWPWERVHVCMCE